MKTETTWCASLSNTDSTTVQRRLIPVHTAPVHIRMRGSAPSNYRHVNGPSEQLYYSPDSLQTTNPWIARVNRPPVSRCKVSVGLIQHPNRPPYAECLLIYRCQKKTVLFWCKWVNMREIQLHLTDATGCFWDWRCLTSCEWRSVTRRDESECAAASTAQHILDVCVMELDKKQLPVEFWRI